MTDERWISTSVYFHVSYDGRFLTNTWFAPGLSPAMIVYWCSGSPKLLTQTNISIMESYSRHKETVSYFKSFICTAETLILLIPLYAVSKHISFLSRAEEVTIRIFIYFPLLWMYYLNSARCLFSSPNKRSLIVCSSFWHFMTSSKLCHTGSET